MQNWKRHLVGTESLRHLSLLVSLLILKTMKETKKRWTDEEEQVLISQVKIHSRNLAEAFRVTSTMIDRTEDSIRQHWYLKCNKESYCFLTVGNRTININRKIVTPNTSDNTDRISATKWAKILAILNE